ncbi:MAG: GIY-YIG nuclease family protein [Candidatus Daviesbacteria bacterium]|nr:GIY-YIG nuclease family protein [Candidatus Daviesbacteria bacterium]
MSWLRFKSEIPRRPGVYIFKDKDGKILYVGKAVDLYQRVTSYGVNLTHTRGGIRIHRDNTKVATLVEHIAKVETITVESELEALILEANLIKKYLPPFNVRLTDDKDYLYIAVSKEAFPKIVTARKKDLQIMKKHWGPFPSSRTVRETLKSLRKVFPWCAAASQGDALRSKTRFRPCFYYHLKLCPGACIGLISKEEYNKIINRFSKFMDGKKEQLITELTAEMKQAGQKQKFEEAAKIKKTIEGIFYLTQTNRTGLYLENPNFLQDEGSLALEQLKKDLNLGKLPERIEGYDISNIQGYEATGSMVVLTKGEIDKSQYRKFKISSSAGGFSRPNDVAMIREVLRRRLKHTEWPLPDLILVDGGRGQARAVQVTIQQFSNAAIPVFGLAKRMEWLYPPKGEILKLPRKSLSLKLLQKLRDEAHRFAISYHRKLRDRIIV